MLSAADSFGVHLGRFCSSDRVCPLPEVIKLTNGGKARAKTQGFMPSESHPPDPFRLCSQTQMTVITFQTSRSNARLKGADQWELRAKITIRSPAGWSQR